MIAIAPERLGEMTTIARKPRRSISSLLAPLRDLAQESVHVPLSDMGLVESIHLLLFHWILDDVHARIYSKGRYDQKPATTRRAPSRRKAA